MRLLKTRTGEFEWIENPEQLCYAILSHVWSTDGSGEQTYTDLCRIQEQVRDARAKDPSISADEVLRRASSKIRNACAFALAEGIEHIWIDTCCIDKTSSAELGEAINSMYDWYRLSTVCYAFLHDVDGHEDPYLEGASFRRSRWHERGWTLQELIAPRAVVFLSSAWRFIGAKHGMADLIEEVTGIDEEVLTCTIHAHSVSVARRMSWASRRVTTRTEDEAYSLMGIFGVNMPIIYGEGRMAFVRLQEEILKRIPDQSIFIWSHAAPIQADEQDVHYAAFAEDTHHSLLASSPALFSSSRNVVSITKDALAAILGVPIPPPAYTTTSYGLRATFPLIQMAEHVFVAVLACTYKEEYLLGLMIKMTKVADMHSVGVARTGEIECFRGWNMDIIAESSDATCIVCIPLDPQRRALDIHLEAEPRVQEVHIVHRPFITSSNHLDLSPFVPHDSYKLELSERCQAGLTSLGYLPPLIFPCVDSHQIVLTNDMATLVIEIALCECARLIHEGDVFRFALRLTTPHGQLLSMATTPGGIVVCGLRQGWDHWEVRSKSSGIPMRRYQFIPTACDSQPQEIRLSIVCDYPGDHRYPSRFSLSIEVTCVSALAYVAEPPIMSSKTRQRVRKTKRSCRPADDLRLPVLDNSAIQTQSVSALDLHAGGIDADLRKQTDKLAEPSIEYKMNCIERFLRGDPSYLQWVPPSCHGGPSQGYRCSGVDGSTLCADIDTGKTNGIGQNVRWPP